jgi:hypothetical protein
MTLPPSKARSWKCWPDTSEGRSEKGVVYLNIEPKYLLDYMAETAFREDHRRLAPVACADQATACEWQAAVVASLDARTS